MKKLIFSLLLLSGMCALVAQKPDIIGEISKGNIPAIAVPDFRGAGAAQPLMGTFNATLLGDLQNAAQIKIVPKTLYPLTVPQQPSDLVAPDFRGSAPQGKRLADWAGTPVSANYLAVGYAAERDGQIVLFGWLYSTSVPDLQGAQVLGKIYTGALNEDGAKKVAHEYAADILAQFGGKSLAGTRIVFVSDRTGHKEIWSMNYDGSDQKQITHYGSISSFPAVSPDGTKVAFTTYVKNRPEIYIHSLDPGRRLTFYNQQASMNAFVDFTPDGRQLVFSSTAGGGPAQIFMANTDGSNLRRISSSRTIEVEPKINPKTGAQILVVSGRSGLPQIYKMNLDGADIQRLTNGQGEATNPAWNPDGQHIAFAWTRGFEPGAYNIFVMDVASGELLQLTRAQGRNENPTWAPDGVHLAFSSKRGGQAQIYSMLADGTKQQQLTTVGNNEKPVWAKAVK